MFYYRFRPLSELSIKELMYDEIYFSSTEESNDPYEGKIFFKFEKSEEKWRRLLDVAWKQCEKLDVEKYKDILSKYLFEKSPLTFDEVQNLTFDECALQLKNMVELRLFATLITLFKNYVSIYQPDKKYFVSFARSCDNYLMWSHYANKHNGYCLIFRTIDGYIFQDKAKKRTNISRSTPNSFSPRMSYTIPDKFEIYDVCYNDSEEIIDSFLCFPEYINGYKFEDEKERIEHFEKLRKPFLEKDLCWEYEQESRLLLNTPQAWLFGENIEYTKYERLLHYDLTQLVGIVLGHRMCQEDKDRIKAIIKDKVDSWHDFDRTNDSRYIFDFVLFEAELSSQKRVVEIKPKEIYGGVKALTPNDEGFEKKYNDWKEGYCIEFSGNSARRVKIY